MPLFFCPVAPAEPVLIGAGDSVSEGYRPDLFQDVPDQSRHMLTSGAHVPGMVAPIAGYDPSSPASSHKDPDNDNPYGALPDTRVGGGMLCNHLRYSMILQVGILVVTSPMEVYDVLLGTLTGLIGSVLSSQKNRELKLKYFGKLIENSNVICLQEVHGKDEFLQAVQVLAPRFKIFGTFFPGVENAGGTAICIHKDLLPEDAIVTHTITCQGRDRVVSIQSGQKNLVIVDVHLEPELTLRRLRERLRPIAPHCLAFISQSCGHYFG